MQRRTKKNGAERLERPQPRQCSKPRARGARKKCHLLDEPDSQRVRLTCGAVWHLHRFRKHRRRKNAHKRSLLLLPKNRTRRRPRWFAAPLAAPLKGAAARYLDRSFNVLPPMLIETDQSAPSGSFPR